MEEQKLGRRDARQLTKPTANRAPKSDLGKLKSDRRRVAALPLAADAHMRIQPLEQESRAVAARAEQEARAAESSAAQRARRAADARVGEVAKTVPVICMV